MAFTGTVDGALTGWIETLYHRIPFVHPNSTRYGWGMAAGGDARCEVVDYLYGQADKPGPGRWPLPDASDVPASWHGYESPQPPLPAGESYPSGPVVTITFKSGSQPQLTSASLVDSVGEPVAVQVQSPANDPWLTDTWSLYAYDPLASGQTYTVTFDGVVSGQPLTEVWQFTTR